jgi:flagellar FliL protein
MSNSKEKTETKPRKGKGLIMKLLIGLGLAGAGGGVFGLVNAGVIGGGHRQDKVDNTPRLVRKGEVDPYAPKAEGAKDGAAPEEVDGEGGSQYRTSYFNFAEDFTSNLKNSQALVQVSLAASTRRDGRVLHWMKKHELAIRSALLAVLADTPEEEVYTVEGKNRMQVRLTAAINQVLTDNEGFGGVDRVYFKSFLVQ